MASRICRCRTCGADGKSKVVSENEFRRHRAIEKHLARTTDEAISLAVTDDPQASETETQTNLKVGHALTLKDANLSSKGAQSASGFFGKGVIFPELFPEDVSLMNSGSKLVYCDNRRCQNSKSPEIRSSRLAKKAQQTAAENQISRRSTTSVFCITVAQSPHVEVYDTTKYSRMLLSQSNPLVIKSVFLPVLLHHLENVSRDSCRFVLEFMKGFLVDTINVDGSPLSISKQRMLKGYPLDLRTVERTLQMDPEVLTYAVCPLCNFVIEPRSKKTEGSSFDVFEPKCPYKAFPSDAECGAQITKSKVEKGESFRTPIKPFLVHNLNSFIARLIFRPKILELLVEGMDCYQSGTMKDIKQGSVLSAIKAADGSKFMDSTSGELRLAWSLAIDWFNPYLNKASGKTASCGAIIMACLNLPPHLRHKAENVFLVGIIPGPKEPSNETINHFLRPVVDILLRSYEHGTRFTHSTIHPDGIISRSIIALLVGDQPGARKVASIASYSHHTHCTTHANHTKDTINDVAYENWIAVSGGEHRKAAETWRNASSPGARRQLYKANGIRWSELLRLPYWEPTNYVVVDGMHNLFLGLVQFHVRNILGLDDETAMKARSSRKSSRLKKAEATCHLDSSRVWGPSALRVSDDSPLVIGINFFDEDDLRRPPRVDLCHLSKKEVATIRSNIAATKRPHGSRGPPKSLGKAGHGKLKADQWRSTIEFEIPVSLIELAAKAPENRMLGKLARSTALLAAAIGIATRKESSRDQVKEYKELMAKYLSSLLELRPGLRLRPNHHSALHLADFILRYGPVHGWWMYPFERIIGTLQQINTNEKIGELEQTMLNSFCKTSSVRAFLESPACPEILVRSSDVLEKRLSRNRTNMDPSEHSDEVLEGTVSREVAFSDIDWHRMEILDPGIRVAFERAYEHICTRIERWATPKKAIRLQRISIRNFDFTDSRTARGHPFIFFQPLGTERLVPGIIITIISIPIVGECESVQEHRFLIAQRFLPLGDASDPFAGFPNFGASVWASEMSDTFDVIPTWSWNRVYHAVLKRWGDKMTVLKAVDR